ncbi:MAG: EF-hand domain-containing protein [Pseudomonadota bacterium]
MKKWWGPAMLIFLVCTACTGKGKEPLDGSIAEDFRLLDANHDGSITKDETEMGGTPELLGSFEKFDANKDGKLSLQEITDFVLMQRAKDARRKEEAFARLDTNHDGGVSTEEASKGNADFLITYFAEMDVNKDQKLSLEEINTYTDKLNEQLKKAGQLEASPPEDSPPPASQAKGNSPEKGSGASPSAPSQRGGRAGPLFKQVDTDDNGTLSREELKARPELYNDFDKIDADHDGAITPLEIDTFVRAQGASVPKESNTKK